MLSHVTGKNLKKDKLSRHSRHIQRYEQYSAIIILFMEHTPTVDVKCTITVIIIRLDLLALS